MTDRNDSCEARLPAQLAGRVEDFAALTTLAQHYGEITDEIKALAESQDIEVSDDGPDYEVSEAAQERIYEYPLGLSTYKVHRIELSTGGPADYLEVFVDDGDIQRIVYHFADWFDHASCALTGAEFDAAEAFVLNLIPEL